MRNGLIEKTFEWDLRSSPEALWPILSDTPRLNEALDLPLYRLTETIDRDGRRRRYGDMEEDGVRIRWEEPPFEWAEGRWWRWRRFYETGPLRETSGMLVLTPTDQGGTKVAYTLSVEPNSTLGRLLIASGHLRRAADDLESLAHKADAYCENPMGDFFANLAAEAKRPVSVPKIPCVTDTNSDAELLGQLASWLAVAPLSDVSDVRPRRLVQALGIDTSEAIRACLLAVEGDALIRRYDAICPSCRASAIPFESLTQLPALLACQRCGAGYRRDLAGNVEALFSVAPSIRPDPGGVYCASGAATAPHVVTQQIVDPMERREIEMPIRRGTYLVRVADGAVSPVFDLEDGADLHVELTESGLRLIDAGDPGVVFENRSNLPFVVSLERCAWRDDALPVADIIMDQEFRELASGERLAEGESAPSGLGALVVVASPVLSASEMLTIARNRGGALFAADDAAWSLVFPTAVGASAAVDDLLKAFPQASISADYGELEAATSEGAFKYAGLLPETARSHALSAAPGTAERSPRLLQMLEQEKGSAPL